jgi:glycosyltransferase involved in cell wall biosynthesis
MKKPIILTLVACYLPGFRAGGPIRTIVNMVENLGDEFDFRIITSDRDLGEARPYTNVKVDEFNDVGKAKVFYASPKMMSLGNLKKLLKDIPHDVMYLNSFFSPRFTIRPLLLRLLGVLPDKPVIVAPRGEFSEGALKLKSPKKRAYIAFSKTMGLYKNVIWQASSEYEERDIRKWFGGSAVVHIAPNLTPAAATANQKLYQNRRQKEKGFLKIIFLSRISPKKNLDGALRILEKVKGCVEMNIYGPVTDEAYWAKCREIIDRMPNNVKVTYKGSVPHEEVPKVMAEHDLFFFPTHGENFGHVIHEALSVGTPVLISDQTPWRELGKHQAGWDLSLSNEDNIVNVVEFCCSMPPQELFKYNKGAYSFIAASVKSAGAINANREMFNEAYQMLGNNNGEHKK